MRELPRGEVTFLFTDIEGSTRLLHEFGDRYPEVLAEHRRALRAAFERHGGVEVDTQGDAFFVAFADAGNAVAAAAAAQASLAKGPTRVRMGVHTGEPIVWAEGYAGVDVHRGARICAAAHGGQVVLSERTRSLVDGVAVRDLGAHRLKDLSEPQSLYQLGDAQFPPLRTLHTTNLPIQPTPLVGRERELAEASALVHAHRIVTLLGPGGSGKTRLALQVAADALEEFPHGVFWVPLQAVSDPALVLPTIADTLGARGGVAEFIGDKRLILLLDNLEQIVDVAPELAELVAATPNAKLLVTSREPLRVKGERRYPVDPLPEVDAIALFVERARAVDPTFEPSRAVAEICRRLDGLPLALELAAARVSVLSGDELLARLERVLPILTGGMRAPARQRTLRSTIEWSHDLLCEDEQALFRRLAAFAVSFAADAIGPVCDGDLDTFQSLVEKNLVRRWSSGRFGMLETIAEYAAERLDASSDSAETRRRHAEHYLGVAGAANVGPDDDAPQDEELAVLEQPNFRKALTWAARDGDAELGLRLAAALGAFWVVRDPFEGMRWFDDLFARAGDVQPDVRARALLAQGGLVFIVGEFDRGTRIYEQSLDQYRALEDEAGIAHVLHRLASSAMVKSDFARARMLAEESLTLHRRVESRRGEGIALGTLADIEWRAGGNRDASFELAKQSAAIAREVGFPWWEAASLFNLCEWSLEVGRPIEAELYGREALEIAARIGDRMHAAYLLALLARVAAEAGQAERAGVLWGALEAEERRGRIGQWDDERETYAAPVLAHAGPAFEQAREAGSRLTLEEAVSRLLADS